jgi:hypothetical protein
MNRFRMLLSLLALSCVSVGIILLAQDVLTIDATTQPSSPARGRGPFPGSIVPGHSAGLHIRLDLLIQTPALRPDGTVFVDFVLTNVGTEPISLPSSIDQNIGQKTSVLTLWLTSDGLRGQTVKDQQTGTVFKSEVVVTSAELYGRSGNSQSFNVLAPGTSMRVHASSRVQLSSGTHSITAHAEVRRISKGNYELVGTADSEAVLKTITASPATAR